MSEYEQLQLDLGKIKPIDPWKLSRSQFERLSDTVWRAESSEHLGSHFDPHQSGGLHFGTKEAALERGGQVAAARSGGINIRPPVAEDQPVRLFSARVTGRFGNKRENPGKDIGSYWPTRARGHWYKNQVEGIGSVSGYVPKREGFLKTHREMVLDAAEAGKNVHPNILWEAQQAPEWSDTVEPREGWRPLDPGPLFPGSIGGILLNYEEVEAQKKGGSKGLMALWDEERYKKYMK